MEKIVHDADAHRFRLSLREGGEAYVEYASRGSDTLDLLHTVVPPAAQGQGHGSALVEHVFEYARAQGKTIIPTCPFVASWLDEHPAYRSLAVSV